MSNVAAPARLVVLAPNWLGDAVMALPLVEDLRRAWPETEIAIAARWPVVPLFERVPGITHTVTLDSGSGIGSLSALGANAIRLARGTFDAALLLPNSFQSAWMAFKARIPERWGFRRDLRGRLLTVAVARPRRYGHQAEYYQALGTGLGIPVGPSFARIEVAEDDKARARRLLVAAGLDQGRRFVVFAPGAAYGGAKQWLPERFAELATMLAERDIATALVGSNVDRSVCAYIAEQIRRTSPGSVFDVCGKTDLTTLAGVLALGDGLVSNDSGGMHLGAAAGARVVAVFGPTDDRKTSPLRAGPDGPTPVVLAASVWCRPCMLRECPIDHRCMSRVAASAVLEALALT